MIMHETGYLTKENGTWKHFHYFIKDHLGNNRLVVNQSGAIVQSLQYEPFGMTFADGINAGWQPYKFGGKEEETDCRLNWYDFESRLYVPDLGRFMQPDPLAEKYYSISPYAYCGNNPVNNVDLRGDSITTVVTSMVNGVATNTTYYYGQDANGNYGFLDSSGNLYSGGDQFVASLTTALGSLRSGGAKGQALVDDLMGSTNTVQIANRRDNKADPNGKYVLWNPNSTTGGINAIGNENRPAYIGLGHEMGHIQDVWNGTYDASAWVTIGSDVIPNAEKYATHVENQLRAENNILLRTHYGIDASGGTRVGLESTRIVRGGVSTFYMQPNGTVRGIPLLRTPYRYR